jgi:hypothetical protein
MKYEECPEEHMLAEARHWTLCEYLRDIYAQLDRVGGVPEIIADCKRKLRISTTIAKDVTHKLAEYEPHWKDLERHYDRREEKRI